MFTECLALRRNLGWSWTVHCLRHANVPTRLLMRGELIDLAKKTT